MKHCPKCYCEYEEWAKECADCHVALVSGEVTEEQMDYFRVQLSPNKHARIIKIQITIMAIVGLFIAITTFFQLNYILKSGFFSQPAELMGLDVILLGIFYATYNFYSRRKKERDGFLKTSQQQSLSRPDDPPRKN